LAIGRSQQQFGGAVDAPAVRCAPLSAITSSVRTADWGLPKPSKKNLFAFGAILHRTPKKYFSEETNGVPIDSRER
jgi:hypothetical protein